VSRSSRGRSALPLHGRLEQRCAETAAAVDEALTALRDADRSGDPDVHEAYLNAVLDHGAVLRDIAD
jgi:hypothetical protein